MGLEAGGAAHIDEGLLLPDPLQSRFSRESLTYGVQQILLQLRLLATFDHPQNVNKKPLARSYKLSYPDQSRSSVGDNNGFHNYFCSLQFYLRLQNRLIWNVKTFHRNFRFKRYAHIIEMLKFYIVLTNTCLCCGRVEYRPTKLTCSYLLSIILFTNKNYYSYNYFDC